MSEIIDKNEVEVDVGGRNDRSRDRAESLEPGKTVRGEHPSSARVAPRPLTLAIATAGGVGYSPIAPGTCGSVVGVALYLPMSTLHPALFAVTLAGLLFLGIWVSDHAEREFGRADDGRIVIDEVVGQLLTLSPLLLFPADIRSVQLLVVGFALFRVFDIWKPGPVSWTERHFHGGAGVMLDDVVAGVFGATALAPIAWFAGSSA